MALNLYAIPDASGKFEELSPLTFTFDGIRGGAIDKKVYLRNDDLKKWYSNIALEAVDTADVSERLSMVTEGVPGFFWKLAQGDHPLFLEEWEFIGKGNSISIADDLGDSTFGDVTTYLPVWIRVQIPSYIPIMTVKKIVVRIDATENYVNG